MSGPRIDTGLDSPWLLRASPNPRAALRLFCLPHAGGDTWIFRDWQNGLPPFVEVCAIRLPGRGSRMAEAPITIFDDLVRTIGAALLPACDRPFAFYGNSMGALLAFELTRHLREVAGASPAMLCVGSCRAPQLAYFPTISNLSPRLLMAEVQRRYGTSMGDIARNDELMQLTMPILRADLELCESYRYREAAALACPVTAYGGTDDAMLETGAIDAWATQTSGMFARHEVIGDHFFAVGSQAAFLRILSRDLDWAMA